MRKEEGKNHLLSSKSITRDHMCPSTCTGQASEKKTTNTWATKRCFIDQQDGIESCVCKNGIKSRALKKRDLLSDLEMLIRFRVINSISTSN